LAAVAEEDRSAAAHPDINAEKFRKQKQGELFFNKTKNPT